MTHLEVRDLAALRGEERIFAGLSFLLSGGEAMIVRGANGSGKTTVLRVIAGLLPADAGHVSVTTESGPVPRASEACHYLGHRNAMKRELTVEENLRFWKSFMGDFAGGKGVEPEDAADALGLEQLLHLPFGYLSAGQQRRMAMAKLLVAWRPVWLLDEPTAALDSRSEEIFTRLMKEHREKGGIVVAATHQPLGLERVREMVMTGFEYREMLV